MLLDLSQFDAKGLDLIFDINEDMCNNLLQDIRKESKSESENHKEKLRKLGYFLCELKHVSDEIDKRRQEKLIYSIQDIYKFAGQFDKFVSFSFYKTSDAYMKYGNDAYGNLIYQKKERNNLEIAISNENYERTDGLVLLKGASKDKDKNELLASEGFLVSDVFEVLSFDNFNVDKQYKKEGQKEIPNKIEIKFDPTEIDLEKLQVYNTSNKIKDGHTLLRHEYIELYANLMVLNPEKVSQENKEEYLLNKDKKTFTEDVSVKILSAKNIRNIITTEELVYLKRLLKERRIQRFEVVKKELGISNNQIKKFEEAYPDNYRELWGSILAFQTETLSTYKTKYPIYWDFERFAHIYLRHYRNFFIEESTVRGTHFQYSYKDIRRVASLIIEKLKEEIEDNLSQGKIYGKWGDKGFYFNGNYYVIRINSTGKLMQFHPLS